MENLIKIKEGSCFKGAYSGSGDLELHGSFQGFLSINNLFITKSGIFFGKLAAKKIIVEGEVIADIETEILHLKQTGIIDGDLIYRKLIIESGGMLKSSRVFSMSKTNIPIKFKRNN